MTVFKIIQALRGLKSSLAANSYPAVAAYAADILDGMGKTEAADALRQIVQGLTDESAHDIAVGAAREIFNALEAYYGDSFPHVKVMAMPDAERAGALADHMDGHSDATVVGGPRLKAVPPEVWIALANVIANAVMKLIDRLRNK